jgi:hypothetical protein
MMHLASVKIAGECGVRGSLGAVVALVGLIVLFLLSLEERQTGI